MAMTEWRTHRGKPYLYIDHSGTEKQTLDNLNAALKVIQDSGSQEIRILANADGAFGTEAVMSGLQSFALATRPYVIRRSVVGVKGIQRVLLLIFNTFASKAAAPRETEAEALAYLFPD